MSEEPKILASISGGKDSLAALITHIESGGRCDGAVYCRIMFDDETSAEYPEHEDFLFNKCFPALEREYGVKTRVVQASCTYEECFYRRYKRGKNAGEMWGFPTLWCPWCNTKLKINPMHKFKKEMGKYTSIVGIADKEENRIKRDFASRRARNYRGGGFRSLPEQRATISELLQREDSPRVLVLPQSKNNRPKKALLQLPGIMEKVRASGKGQPEEIHSKS